MIIYSYYFLLFYQILTYSSVFSLKNTTFYLFDKDSFYNQNRLYEELCLDFSVDGVSCMILRRDIVNNLSPNRCFLFRLDSFREDLCYYLSFGTTLAHDPSGLSIDSLTILYPYYSNISTNISPTFDSNKKELNYDFIKPLFSLMELENDFRYDRCLIMTNEICRINDLFSGSLDSLINGDRFNVLSILARKSPVTDKINYNIHKDLDIYVPSPYKFHNYVLSSITDQFYIHKNEMLKELEYSLKFRECVLLNELDLLFFNITQFPLNLYKELIVFIYLVI